MTYIAPDSTVQFYGDISLSDSYENSLFFSSTAAKDQYFDDIPALATCQAMSYNRSEQGFFRVEVPISTLYLARYLRFKNTSFENKWFYAFVDSVEYINNITTQINFSLDYLLTWMGSFTLGQCYVERQHTVTDAIGDNIVDESLPCGDLVIEGIENSGFIASQAWEYCVAATLDIATYVASVDAGDIEIENIGGGLYGGIYSGLYYSYASDISTLIHWITVCTEHGKSDAIVGIALVPGYFKSTFNSYPVEATKSFDKPYTDLNGYVPKNNKMFIYPYKSLQVTNLEGAFAEFRYEFFSGNGCYFKLVGSTGLKSEIVCYPFWYKTGTDNLPEKIAMSDFPLCSWTVDAYQAYLAQNKSKITTDVLSSAFSVGTSLAAAAANPAGAVPAVGNALLGITGKLATLQDYQRKPPQAGGAQGTDPLIGRAISQYNDRKDFYFIKKTITAQYARVIDDYFTMFGYRIDRLTTPNMNARPHWTYLKTIGCIVHGMMPADHARRIEAIFDAGIRLWKNHSQIGLYGLDNSPA